MIKWSTGINIIEQRVEPLSSFTPPSHLMWPDGKWPNIFKSQYCSAIVIISIMAASSAAIAFAGCSTSKLWHDSQYTIVIFSIIYGTTTTTSIGCYTYNSHRHESIIAISINPNTFILTQTPPPEQDHLAIVANWWDLPKVKALAIMEFLYM